MVRGSPSIDDPDTGRAQAGFETRESAHLLGAEASARRLSSEQQFGEQGRCLRRVYQRASALDGSGSQSPFAAPCRNPMSDGVLCQCVGVRRWSCPEQRPGEIMDRPGVIEFEQSLVCCCLRKADIEADDLTFGDAAEPACVVFAEAHASCSAERLRQRDRHRAVTGDAEQTVMDEVDAGRAPQGDARQRQDDLEFGRLGVRAQELGCDEVGDAGRKAGVHQDRPVRSAGLRAKGPRAGSGKCGDVDQDPAVCQHCTFSQQAGMRNRVDHEFVTAQCAGNRGGPIEVDVDLTTSWAARGPLDVPPRGPERTRRHRPERTSGPDDQYPIDPPTTHGGEGETAPLVIEGTPRSMTGHAKRWAFWSEGPIEARRREPSAGRWRRAASAVSGVQRRPAPGRRVGSPARISVRSPEATQAAPARTRRSPDAARGSPLPAQRPHQ